MAVVWTCREPTCGQTFKTRTEICPKCGGPMRGIGEAPWRGWLLLICGVALIGMMTAILMAIGGDLDEAIATGSSDGFTGTSDQARLIVYLFYAIIAFGVVSAANGVFQLVTRRQHWAFIAATLVVFAVLIYYVVTAMQALD